MNPRPSSRSPALNPPSAHPAKNPPLDLAALRKKLDGLQGQLYWRSLDELAETEEFRQMLQREFPEGASEWDDGLSRRSFLKMAAASLALAGLSACTRQPMQQILPYVRQPEDLVLGEPLQYATAMLLGGYATGVLAKSREGHPIKVDGNPQHPASLGASSIWMQASLLDLYDPDRSQSIVHNGDLGSWADFISEANTLVREHEKDQGAGLRFLTPTVTSPTLAWQLEELTRRFPKAKWQQFEPVSRDNIREGAQLAFGEAVEPQYRFDKAAVIVSLDSDFLYAHPQRLKHARDFANGRRVGAGANQMSRLYVLESTPTVTGTMADHRFPVGSGAIQPLTCRLAQQLGLLAGAQSATPAPAWLEALVRDLQKNRGRSLLIAGEWQPPLVHALVHLLNEQLGNAGRTVYYTKPAEANPVNQLESLRELVAEIKSGAVRTLFILGGNPVYTAPADFELGRLLPRVQRSIHLGLEFDETAALCAWHIPEAHYLESWGDGRSPDGTITMMQPLIEPLYGGKSALEVLGVLTHQQPTRTDYEIVRAFWAGQKRWPDFEDGWRRAVCDGFIADSAAPEKKIPVRADAVKQAAEAAAPAANPSEIEITFRPDPSVWDGRFANNGWLQECARPVNKLTWDNAVLVSPALAQRLGVSTDDVVEISLGRRAVRGPVWVMPGQAENSVTLHLGYGRQRVGRVGNGVGFNAYRLRASGSFWLGAGAKLSKVDGRHHLVSTQTHHNLHSPDRQVYREGTLEQFRAHPDFVKDTVESPPNDETLYETGQYKYDGYKWAMSIDLTACIGCNACLLACNVENNIPVVGKDQVSRHREMYWIRIDTYYQGSIDAPEFNQMPVPCMQCEHAPCELVCPVEATVHDHEGLNVMVYNRCIGTRFCSNNCPYKVRRFNFLRYTDYQTPSLKPMYNPEVTVRWRGVMEKCTYCVQRIAAARIRAEKQNRRIHQGEVQTACQQACPAQAIVFGDLNAPDSPLARLKAHPLDYSMLGELNTRPRTTYLARLRNPNPEIENGRPA